MQKQMVKKAVRSIVLGAALVLAFVTPSQSAETMTSTHYMLRNATLSSAGVSGATITTGSIGYTVAETVAIGFSAEFVNGVSDHAGFWPSARDAEICTRLMGDWNCDGHVDDADWTIWADNYGRNDGAWKHGDGNGDHIVDDVDWTLWADNYGASR